LPEPEPPERRIAAKRRDVEREPCSLLTEAAALGRSDPGFVRQDSLASSVPKPRTIIRVASATRRIIAGGRTVGAGVTQDTAAPHLAALEQAAGTARNSNDTLPLLEVRVFMGVWWGAAAKEAKASDRADLMPRTRRDQHRVACGERPAITVELQLALSFEHEVDLLAAAMIVTPCRLV
jgi:hypothetical protein